MQAAERTLLDDINRRIGGLVEQMKGLAADQSEAREESRDHRRVVYERLDEAASRARAATEKGDAAFTAILARLTAVEVLAAATSGDVSEMKPTFDAMQAWKHRGVGFTAAVALAFALIGGSLVAKWDALKTAIQSVLGGNG